MYDFSQVNKILPSCIPTLLLPTVKLQLLILSFASPYEIAVSKISGSRHIIIQLHAIIINNKI